MNEEVSTLIKKAYLRISSILVSGDAVDMMALARSDLAAALAVLKESEDVAKITASSSGKTGAFVSETAGGSASKKAETDTGGMIGVATNGG